MTGLLQKFVSKLLVLSLSEFFYLTEDLFEVHFNQEPSKHTFLTSVLFAESVFETCFGYDDLVQVKLLLVEVALAFIEFVLHNRDRLTKVARDALDSPLTGAVVNLQLHSNDLVREVKNLVDGGAHDDVVRGLDALEATLALQLVGELEDLVHQVDVDALLLNLFLFVLICLVVFVLLQVFEIADSHGLQHFLLLLRNLQQLLLFGGHEFLNIQVLSDFGHLFLREVHGLTHFSIEKIVLVYVLHQLFPVNVFGVKSALVSGIEHLLEVDDDLLVLQVIADLFLSEQKLLHFHFSLGWHHKSHSFDVAFEEVGDLQVFITFVFGVVFEAEGARQLLGQLHGKRQSVLASWQPLLAFVLEGSRRVINEVDVVLFLLVDGGEFGLDFLTVVQRVGQAVSLAFGHSQHVLLVLFLDLQVVIVDL